MTSFYHREYLAEDTGKTDRYGNRIGFFKIGDLDNLVQAWATKSPGFHDHYISERSSYAITRYEFIFAPNDDWSHVRIAVRGFCKNGYQLVLAGVTISTIDSNCGAVLLSNLYSDFHGAGFGTFLLDQVLEYLKIAGYSFILMNTAGSTQNALGDHLFVNKYGFTPMAPGIYRNIRSGNINIWYFKYLNNVDTISYEFAEAQFKNGTEEDEDED